MIYPKKILHWLDDKEYASSNETYFPKINPATGQEVSQIISGNKEDVNKAIEVAKASYLEWSKTNINKRAEILKKAALLIEERKEEIAEIASFELGKPNKDSINEAQGASLAGQFIATLTNEFDEIELKSNNSDKKFKSIRQSMGIGLLIVPFNNPIASISWKAFPSLFCGNSVILKSHRYTPYTAIWFAKILKEAGLPSGVFTVLQGSGKEVGDPLVKHNEIQFIGFTGSAVTASSLIKESADRLAKVAIEAGGKNPIVICDDADLDKAVELSILSAFVDGGQRCAATSRIIVVESIYQEFKDKFLEKVKTLKVGISDDSSYGAIVSEKRMNEILNVVSNAIKNGATVLTGNKRIDKEGFFLEPTVLENVSPYDDISQNEIFGPVVILFKVKDFNEALEYANNSKYKLSSAIHTKNMDLAREFIQKHYTGVVRVNGPTYGSEPNMPFGGVGLSGNGWREPGVKALDIYSEWKQISYN